MDGWMDGRKNTTNKNKQGMRDVRI